MDQLELNGSTGGDEKSDGDLPIRLIDTTILRGFNIYHPKTVIRQTVDLGTLAGMRSGQFGLDFGTRFSDSFRALRQQVPGEDLAKDFLDRLNDPDGVSIEEALLEAIVAVETSIAFEMGNLEPVAFRTIENVDPPREISLIWSCTSRRFSQAAAEIGLAGLVALLPDDLYPSEESVPDAINGALATLQREARRKRPPAATAALIRAAKQREIPCEASGGPRLRLGEGVFQRHIFASATSKTALWTHRLADDKRYLRRRLTELGLPVVRQFKAATVDEARQAAQRLGSYRVSIRPLDQERGRTQLAATTTIDDIGAAFESVASAGSGAIVESFTDGSTFTLLVVGGRTIATARLMPPIVEGDGTRTIEQLIQELNNDSFRDGFRMRKVAVDERLKAHLGRIGSEFSDVLAAGEVVALRPSASVATGGVAVDVTDQVHPDNLDMALRAAEAVELDVAGVEFVTTDISQSYKDVGGTILNVNTPPDLRCHVWPRHGQSRDVASAILERSLPAGTTGRVPSLLVAGDRGTGPVAREIDCILRGAGKSVGLVLRSESFLNGEQLTLEGSQRRRSLRTVLGDPRVEALVSSISLRQAVRRGLQIDRCHVAAIMNRTIQGDVDSFRQGMKLLVQATSGKLVVGANNAVALDAISGLDPSRLILVSPRLRGATIEEHLAQGGPAVVNLWSDERDRIALFDNDQIVLTIASGLPQGSIVDRAQRRYVEARMFAIALAYGIGMTSQEICQAIENAPPQAVAQSNEQTKEPAQAIGAD